MHLKEVIWKTLTYMVTSFVDGIDILHQPISFPTPKMNHVTENSKKLNACFLNHLLLLWPWVTKKKKHNLSIRRYHIQICFLCLNWVSTIWGLVKFEYLLISWFHMSLYYPYHISFTTETYLLTIFEWTKAGLWCNTELMV